MLVLLAALIVYQATVVRPVDGDTIRVRIESFPAPFDPIDVRVYGVDTPEKRLPPAKSQCEVALGLKASAYAKTLAKPGDVIRVTFDPRRRDKYGRLLGAVTLPDGRDWTAAMIQAGYGRAYGQDGKLTKQPWC